MSKNIVIVLSALFSGCSEVPTPDKHIKFFEFESKHVIIKSNIQQLELPSNGVRPSPDYYFEYACVGSEAIAMRRGVYDRQEIYETKIIGTNCIDFKIEELTNQINKE